jgi:uncharacterized membrane protein YccF (DUF307 family)
MFALSLLLNILWIVFGGLWMAIGWVIAAVLMANIRWYKKAIRSVLIIGEPLRLEASHLAG